MSETGCRCCDRLRAKVAELEAENVEAGKDFREWAAGRRGVEEYLAARCERDELRAQVERLRECVRRTREDVRVRALKIIGGYAMFEGINQRLDAALQGTGEGLR